MERQAVNTSHAGAATTAQFTTRTLLCVECQQEFIFSGGEQRFFAERGFTPPKRCPAHRQHRHLQREGAAKSDAAAPADARGLRFEIKCEGCKQFAFIPFKPQPGRKVYCQDCHNAVKR